MKTAVLLFALILGLIIPTYSQLNLNRKTDTTNEQLSFYSTRKNDHFNSVKFGDKFNDSFNTRVWEKPVIPTTAPEPSRTTDEIYSGDNMPCFNPPGIFSMKVCKPDSTVIHTMPIKKY